MGLPERDEEQISAAVQVILDGLGSGVAAIYHYGSALIGSLQPHSDLDLFVVLHRPTTPAERERLGEGLMAVSGASGTRPFGRPIEVTCVVFDQLRPLRSEPVMDFLYGEWMRDDCAAGRIPDPHPNPDLLVVAATVLEGSTTIAGPDASALIDPIPAPALAAGMLASIPDLMNDLPDDFNVLLTLARMVYTSETGRIVTKDIAADWAAQRLPPDLRSPLAHARSIYVGDITWSEPFPPSREETARWLIERLPSAS